MGLVLLTPKIKKKLDREIMDFSLFLYNYALLSRVAVNEIISRFDAFLSESFVPFIQNQMEHELKPFSTLKILNKAQFILKRNKNLFHRFSTEQLRFKFYKQERFFVPPQNSEIGNETIFVAYQFGHIDIITKPVYAAHISLPCVLSIFFSLPGVFKEIQNYVSSLSEEGNVISNIIQGELWPRKYKDTRENVFPIFLFFDEFESRNPLRSYAGEEKLG